MPVNYKKVYQDIQSVKAMIKGKTFDAAAQELRGFNVEEDMFDYNYGDFCGTILNDNGMAVIDDGTMFELYARPNGDDYAPVGYESEQQIKDLARL